MVESVYSLIFLMFAAVLLVSAAQRLKIPYPLVLVIGGGAISMIPGLPIISFDPNLVMVIILPPILYYAAYSIPFREFKKNFKAILSLAFWLVLVTTLIVGCVFKWLVPEIPYALAFAFGAIVSPPDAVATTAILRRFSVNPKLLATLEGESLVNDASALVINKFVVVALLSGTFSLFDASVDFVKVSLGGIAIGIVCSYGLALISKRFKDSALVVVFSYTIPYIVYILAEMVHVSGVLAVVVSGIIGSQLLTMHFTSQVRVLGWASWDVFIILLNCLVFILIGLQLQAITKEMTSASMITYFEYGVLITGVLMAIRLGWVFFYKGIICLLKGKWEKEQWQEAVILGWSGMRGIVSLIAVLALPTHFPNGSVIEGRDMVIYVTYVVITLSLLIPGLTLPTLVRLFKTADNAYQCTIKVARQRLQKTAQDTIEKLHYSEELIEQDKNFLATYFHSRHRVLDMTSDKHTIPAELEIARKKILDAQREHLIDLWKSQEIDDETLHFLERELDVEEFHFVRAELK